LITRVSRIFELIQTRGAISAFIKWPKFSLSAYQIVSRAIHAGINPKTVVDVGANIGQFMIASSRLIKDVMVFPIEPDPRIAEQLRKNIDSRFVQNVKVTAVGDKIGSAKFNVNRDSQVSSLLPLGEDRIESFPDNLVIEEITVPLTTLDDLFGGEALAEPILLKIDVQGFEDRVIAGSAAFLKRVHWILMEVAFSKLYEGESEFYSIFELLRSHGFRFLRPLNFHISPKTGEIIEMDALFESINPNLNNTTEPS